MRARIAIVAIVLTALLAGAGLYYTQVYAFYVQLDAEQAGGVQMVNKATNAPEDVPFDDFRAIDSDSSPLRYRACFVLSVDPERLADTYKPIPEAEPLNGPGWFDCYDAKEIGAEIEAGTAKVYLGVPNIHYGIDRVVAVMPDGRAFAWHEMNACGAAVYDGEDAPAGCPTPPEGLN